MVDRTIPAGVRFGDEADGVVLAKESPYPVKGLFQKDDDPVSHPSHYTSHPSGIECIQVTEHMGFCLGNAMKYIWRCDEKHDAIEDLHKAIWYIQREIDKRMGVNDAT